MNDLKLYQLDDVLELGESRTTYQIERMIDAGATALVWVAKRSGLSQDGMPERVVVKVARPTLKPTDFDQACDDLRSEGQELGRLGHQIARMSGVEQQAIARVPMPYFINTRDKTRLIMDYAPGEPLTKILLACGGQSFPPEDALKILNQYLRLLRLLHVSSRKCYIDSKFDHLFWHAKNQQLTVIDWNTLGSVTPENERNEVRLAGFFLYAMAVDPVVPDGARELGKILLQQQQATSDEYGYQYLLTRAEAERLPTWQRIPVGLQLLLYRALDWQERPRKIEPYQRIEDLLHDAERLERWMQNEERFRQEQPLEDDDSLIGIEARLAWHDINLRAFHRDTLPKPEDAMLHWQRQREDWRAWERLVVVPNFDLASNEFRYGNYDAARTMIQVCAQDDPTNWRIALLLIYIEELYGHKSIPEKDRNGFPWNPITAELFDLARNGYDFSVKGHPTTFKRTNKVLDLLKDVHKLSDRCVALVKTSEVIRLKDDIKRINEDLAALPDQIQRLPFLADKIAGLDWFIGQISGFDAAFEQLNTSLRNVALQADIQQLSQQVENLRHQLRGMPLTVSLHVRREALDRINHLLTDINAADQINPAHRNTIIQRWQATTQRPTR